MAPPAPGESPQGLPVPVKRGEAWGKHGPLPEEGVIVRTDAEARHIVERARRAGEPPPPLGLLGGDLCRTLGGVGDEARLRSGEAIQVPVDLGAVLIDGRLHWFVAHLVARRTLWLGRLFVAMNAQWLGRWDMAPRSHPNDGLLDTYDASLSFGDLLKARRRVRSGTHVPHPRIAERRRAAIHLELDRLTPIYLDGEPIGSARKLALRVEPDALQCVV